MSGLFDRFVSGLINMYMSGLMIVAMSMLQRSVLYTYPHGHAILIRIESRRFQKSVSRRFQVNGSSRWYMVRPDV